MAGRRFPKRCRHSLIIFKLYPVMGIKDFIMPTINQLVRKRRAKVEKLNIEKGKKIEFKKVLLLNDDKTTEIIYKSIQLFLYAAEE